MSRKPKNAEYRASRKRVYAGGVACLILLLEASISLRAASFVQSEFYADPSERITRPLPVPESVLQILAGEDVVTACMKDTPILRGRPLAAWFVASEIHLNDSSEPDMIVLPSSQAPFLCFHSAEGIGRFWAFRRTNGGYDLALTTSGLSLSVLDTKHNGYRDIRSGGQVGKFGTTTIFRFESGRYREYRKETTEVP